MQETKPKRLLMKYHVGIKVLLKQKNILKTEQEHALVNVKYYSAYLFSH